MVKADGNPWVGRARGWQAPDSKRRLSAAQAKAPVTVAAGSLDMIAVCLIQSISFKMNSKETEAVPIARERAYAKPVVFG